MESIASRFDSDSCFDAVTFITPSQVTLPWHDTIKVFELAWLKISHPRLHATLALSNSTTMATSVVPQSVSGPSSNNGGMEELLPLVIQLTNPDQVRNITK